MTTVNPINDRIRLAREAAGLSLNALAKRVGMTSTGVWNWHHDNSSPRSDVLPRLAEALGVSESWLRTGEEKRPSHGVLDAVIADARTKIGALLGIDAQRVRLTMSLDQAEADVPLWLSQARGMIDNLPHRPRGSAELIAERRQAARDGQ
jgi:HTH-type transcriptional regulator, cell division transcriptional repressor